MGRQTNLGRFASKPAPFPAPDDGFSVGIKRQLPTVGAPAHGAATAQGPAALWAPPRSGCWNGGPGPAGPPLSPHRAHPDPGLPAWGPPVPPNHLETLTKLLGRRTHLRSAEWGPSEVSPRPARVNQPPGDSHLL